MRDLRRNKKTIHYALLSDEKVKDEFGNTVNSFGDIIEAKIFVTGGSGETKENPYGKDVHYDREMITHNMSCPFDEFTKLWIDVDVNKDSDYKITGVYRGLNVIQYAIKKN